jgi:hypothetical protein
MACQCTYVRDLSCYSFCVQYILEVHNPKNYCDLTAHFAKFVAIPFLRTVYLFTAEEIFDEM